MKERPVQETIWDSDFGLEYTRRQTNIPENFGENYKELFGVSRTEMTDSFLSGMNLQTILEVGCNLGLQLNYLAMIGYNNLYGIDVQRRIIAQSRRGFPNVATIVASGLYIPFRDESFDLVFTSGLLIHIAPENIMQVMKEMVRVSRKYIWGLEYFSDTYDQLEYRGLKNMLWKADFAQMFVDHFPNLKIIKRMKYKHLNEAKYDQMYLLERQN